VASIKDALSKSASLECSYTDAEQRTARTYIKNGAVRTDYAGNNPSQSGSVIVRDKKMYMWTPDKKGFMIEIPDVTDTPTQTGEKKKTQEEQFLDELEKNKQYCKTAVVSDSLFTPPAEVNFQDYTQMMQAAPTIGAGAGMSEEDVKKAIEQYGTGQPQ